MSPSRVLQTLLVVVCMANTIWALNHEYPRRNRRIALNEFLVPPPPPRNQGRTGRYVGPQLGPQPPQPQPQESQGYLSRLMGWLNPFSSTSPSYLPPPPPPPPSHQSQHSVPYPIYPPLTDPRQGGPLGPHGPPQPPPYLKHPQPSDFHHHKGKICNACNKVPWVPMQNSEYRKEPTYDGHQNNWALNRPVQVPFDNHHAPSEEVRAPDFSHPQFGQVGPLPNPQLYPGPMPPLYKAGLFASSGPSSVEGNHFQQQASVASEVIASNSYPRENGWAQSPDLAASGTQVDQGHLKDSNYHESVPSSGFENILDYASHDLGPSGAHFENTEVPSTILTPTVTSEIHYEESPLLDLTRDDKQVPTNRPNIKLEQFSGDFATVTANYYAGNDQDLHQGQLESSGTTVSYISDALGLASSSLDAEYSQAHIKTEDRTALSSLVGGRQDHFYQAPSGPAEEPSGPAEESTGPVDKSLRNDSADSRSPRTGPHNGHGGSKTNGPTRSKQVQVIIPYTSQYTPLPFQPSFNEWSVDYNLERTQPRKVPPLFGSNPDNYIGQESRPAGKSILSTNSGPLNPNSTSPTTANRANGTIDVHRLQKNIDNWTIQEYSRATTVSSLLPSSSHPRLLPSKKIPDEYLTTTEPIEQDRHTGSNEIVKVYSLGGFSFNDVEHEASSSDHVEQSIKLDEKVQNTSKDNETNQVEDGVVKVYPTTSKEQVYVVTPVPVRVTTQALRGHVKHDSKGEVSKKATSVDSKKSKGNLDKFEAIERAYQVLPQAVNNLAIASTGKEDLPLWGIMEHEEFAGLGQFDEEQFDREVADGPVLYSGHSKVSHAR